MKRDFREMVLYRLERKYGRKIHTQLVHKNMRELFVAVLLSPQCTDKQINKVTPELFKRYKSFKDYADSDIEELQHYLRGVNYYKTKAKNLKKASAMIIADFGGIIPNTLEELMTLPGVGRKVGNVVLNEGYSIDEGIAVDTHCAVVARRLGLSKHRDPSKIEVDLLIKFPKKDWGKISNLFIELGRDTCKARNKECERCILKDICPSSEARK